MIFDPATGMKPGERYRVASVDRNHDFAGFFLAGKYYLGPDLLTAVGWLEGQNFVYDELDAEGSPIFPESVAGTIDNLTLTMADGASFKLQRLESSEKIATHDQDDSAERSDHGDGNRDKPLRGKVVVITGASSGIGRTAANAFGCEGARLVLAARDEQALFEVLDECIKCGTDAVAVVTDVTSNEQMQALADNASKFGNERIDIWIDNAGVGAVGRFEQPPLDAHVQVIQTDLIGYLRGAYVAWPFFKAQKSGTLINTLSVSSWVPQPYAAAYSASKFGLRGLTEALRGELNEYPNIHVCDIYPAVMDTPGFRDGGNYTGHALKPPPPVYDPHLVAKAMVACAIRPRTSTTIGAAARLARFTHFIVPGFSYLSGRFTRRGIGRSRVTDPSSSNLFAPPDNGRTVEGGWREQTPRPRVLRMLAVAVLTGGCAAPLWRSRRH